MRRFMWWLRVDPEDLERAKRAEAEADQRLRESKMINARWSRVSLDRDSFADALVTIIRGGTP